MAEPSTAQLQTSVPSAQKKDEQAPAARRDPNGVRQMEGFGAQEAALAPTPDADDAPRVAGDDPEAHAATLADAPTQMPDWISYGQVERALAYVTFVRPHRGMGGRVLAILGATGEARVLHAALDYFEELDAWPDPALLYLALHARCLKHADATLVERAQRIADIACPELVARSGRERRERKRRHEDDAVTQYVAARGAPDAASEEPIALGRTVFYDATRREVMPTRPYTLRALADALFDGGFGALHKDVVGLDDGAGQWQEEPAAAHPERLVRPGQKLRFGAGDGVVGAKAEIGAEARGEAMAKERDAAEAAFTPVNAALQADEEARHRDAERRAGGLTTLAADAGAGVSVRALKLFLPSMRAARTVMIYDFADTLSDKTLDVDVGDEVTAEVAARVKAGALPPTTGLRVLTWRVLQDEELGAFVERWHGFDRGQADDAVRPVLARADKEGGAALDDLHFGQLLVCNTDMKVAVLRAGLAHGNTAVQKKLLVSLAGGGFADVLARLVKGGDLDAFTRQFTGDDEAMALIGKLLVDGGLIPHAQHAAARAQGALVWTSSAGVFRGDWGWTYPIGGAKLEVQLGRHGIAGAMAQYVEDAAARYADNGKKDAVTAFADGAAGALLKMGIGTLRLVDHPIESAQALYGLMTSGKLIEVLDKALGDKWKEITDACAEGERSGDWTRYHELMGAATAEVMTAIAGAAQATKLAAAGGKKALDIAKDLRRLGVRETALCVREALRRSGKLGVGKIKKALDGGPEIKIKGIAERQAFAKEIQRELDLVKALEKEGGAAKTTAELRKKAICKRIEDEGWRFAEGMSTKDLQQILELMRNAERTNKQIRHKLSKGWQGRNTKSWEKTTAKDDGGVRLSRPPNATPAELRRFLKEKLELDPKGPDLAHFDKLPDEAIHRILVVAQNKGVLAAKRHFASVEARGLKKAADGMAEVRDIRAQHAKGGVVIDLDQNLAFADVDIPQYIAPTRMTAVSGPESPPGTVRAPVDGRRRFKTAVVDNKDRCMDTEVKILEEIAALLGDTRGVSGTIRIFTERPCCASCQWVIAQFRARYANINVIVAQGA